MTVRKVRVFKIYNRENFLFIIKVKKLKETQQSKWIKKTENFIFFGYNIGLGKNKKKNNLKILNSKTPNPIHLVFFKKRQRSGILNKKNSNL